MHPQPLSPVLRADLIDFFDYVRDVLSRTRSALLGFYRDWPADRLLGPPISLGTAPRTDEVPALLLALAGEKQPARYLAGVVRAQEDLAAVLLQYEQGAFSVYTVAAWRKVVEEQYEVANKALDAADAWMATGEGAGGLPAPAAGRGSSRKAQPNLALLDQKEYLTGEDLAAVLGVGNEAASRRRRRGEFGPDTKVGRRMLVASKAVRAALFPETTGEKQG